MYQSIKQYIQVTYYLRLYLKPNKVASTHPTRLSRGIYGSWVTFEEEVGEGVEGTDGDIAHVLSHCYSGHVTGKDPIQLCVNIPKELCVHPYCLRLSH